jgi:hypothetical protein
MPACFIIMPITTTADQAELYHDRDHFKHVLNHLMIPAVQQAGYEAISPIATGSDVIQAEIIRQLETTDLVLCDITSSNPNVFFELGVRTAVDKPISIVKDSKTPGIPFDTAIVNVHTYDSSLAPWLLSDEIDKLSSHLRVAAGRSQGRNTLWRYFGLTTRAAFQPGESTLEEKVDLILLQLREAERSRPVEVTSNYGANFLLFADQARRLILEAENARAEISGDNNTMRIDMRGFSIQPNTIGQLETLAKSYGFEILLSNYIQSDEDS